MSQGRPTPIMPPPGPLVAPPPATPAIRVRHLWHRFGRADVLRDVSFDVAPGEIFGFIGPNGAGKTTTIRILATLLDPLAGRVEVDGHDVTLEPEAVRRVIGYMPDHAGVYERVTVREYLEFFADAYRAGSGQRTTRTTTEPGSRAAYAVVDAAMEVTDITGMATKLVATLSKGMKQRLQLARILLHDPKVLILDEPASDLDPRARIEIRELLLDLRGMGKTIFLSSHILTELADLCTSVAILEHGRLVVAGPVRDIAARLEARVQAQHAHAQAPGYTPGEPGAPIDPALVVASGAPGYAAPRSDTRTVKLRSLAPAQGVADALRRFPDVTSAEAVPGEVVLATVRGDDRALATLVQQIVGAGIPLVGVEPQRSDLERIFLEVTKGEAR